MPSNKQQIHFMAERLLPELIQFQIDNEISDEDMIPVLRECLRIAESGGDISVPITPLPDNPLLN